MYEEDNRLSPADEAQIVRNLLKVKEAGEGRTCSIDSSWWNQWVRYTGYESSGEEIGCQEERPGPIGRPILDSSDSYSFSQKTISMEVWDQLHIWYGGDNGQVVDEEVEQEVYYVKVYLLNSGRRPFASQFESQVSVREVFHKACRFFCVSPDKRYLYDPEDRKEIPVDQNLELGDAELEDETKLCLLPKASVMDESTIRSVGRLGLENQGNTCYMNSALQVLLHCPEIMDYFLTDKFKEHISRNNPEGSGGKIVEAFADLTKKIWKVGSLRCTRPSRFWDAFSQQYIQFSSKTQHDTAEFAEGVLDGLMEDCNRSAIPKIFKMMDDDASKSDKEIGDENWDYHMARSNSYITDKFHGQYRAVTTCPSCNFSSRKFESFTVLQLGLPHPKACDVSFVLIDVGGNSAPKKMKVVASGKGNVQDVLREVAIAIEMKDPNPTDLLAVGQKKAEGEVVIKELDERIPDFLGLGPLVVYQYPCMELGPRSGGTETHFIHQKQSLYASHYTWSSNHNRDKQKFGFPLVVWIPDLSGIESPKCRSPRKRPYEILEEIFEASLRPAKRQKEEVICLPPCPGTESGITGVESIEMEDMSAALPVFDMMRDGGGFIGTGDWGQSLDSVTDAATPPDLLNIGPSDSIEKSHTAAEEWGSEDQGQVLAVSSRLSSMNDCENQSSSPPKVREDNENSPAWTCAGENGKNREAGFSEETSNICQPVPIDSAAQPPEDAQDLSSVQIQPVSYPTSGPAEDAPYVLNAHHESHGEEMCDASTKDGYEMQNSAAESQKLQNYTEPTQETEIDLVSPRHGHLPFSIETCGQSQVGANVENCENLCGGMVNSFPNQTRVDSSKTDGFRTEEAIDVHNGAMSGDSDVNARASTVQECPNVLLLPITPDVSCSTADAGAGDDADSVAAQGNGSGSDFELGLGSLIADDEPIQYGPAQNGFLPYFSGPQNGKIISSCQGGSYDLMEVDEPTAYSSFSNTKSRKIIVDWTSAGENNYNLEMLQESVVDYQMSQGDQVHTILECFEHDFSPHPLDKNNLWECGRCKKRVEGVKSMRLWKTPDLLLISLKRFNFSGQRSIKLTPKVHFPLYGLDLSEFCESHDLKDSMLYDLCGVCYHHGANPKSGHYTSVAKMPNGRWCEFNDSAVYDISTDDEIVTSSAYLLCYRRQGALVKSAEDILNQKWLAEFEEQRRKADSHFAEDTLTDCEDDSEDNRPTYSSFESSHGGYGRFAKWNSLADDYCHRPWDLGTIAGGMIDTTCNQQVASPNWDHENYSSTLSSYPGNQPDIDSNGSGQLYVRPRLEYQPTPESPTNRSRDNSPEVFP